MPPRTSERFVRVRERPLSERIKDRLLALAEDFNTSEWEETLTDYAALIGITSNIVFIIAQANTTRTKKDDVFSDDTSRLGTGWLSFISYLLVAALASFSVLNAVYTLTRRKHYRLFEQSIDAPPTTPSARRVRVDDSPAASPLGFFYRAIGRSTAEDRAHPDQEKDVWEIAVWDPSEGCLKLLCAFSPIHVVVYSMFLPITDPDISSSVVYFKVLIIGAFLYLQATYLQSFTERRARDMAVINKSVLNEYDTKFVHQALKPMVRDVGIQVDTSMTAGERRSRIDTYQPEVRINVNKEWKVSPNPSYRDQYDPDGELNPDINTRLIPKMKLLAGQTPRHSSYMGSPQVPSSAAQPPADFSSPLKPYANRSPERPRPTARSGDGGNLGAFSHANSPARSAQRTDFNRRLAGAQGEGDGTRRAGSPLKRSSLPESQAGTPYGGGSRGLERRLNNLRATRLDP